MNTPTRRDIQLHRETIRQMNKPKESKTPLTDAFEHAYGTKGFQKIELKYKLMRVFEHARYLELKLEAAQLERNPHALAAKLKSCEESLAAAQAVIDKAGAVGYGNAVTMEIVRIQNQRDEKG